MPDFSCVEFLIGIREFIPLNKEGKLQVKNRTFWKEIIQNMKSFFLHENILSWWSINHFIRLLIVPISSMPPEGYQKPSVINHYWWFPTELFQQRQGPKTIASCGLPILLDSSSFATFARNSIRNFRRGVCDSRIELTIVGKNWTYYRSEKWSFLWWDLFCFLERLWQHFPFLSDSEKV